MRRHRLLWLYLTRRLDLNDASLRRVLHFAPEPAIEQRLRQVRSLNYVTADLHAPRVTERQDITRMTFRNNSFDLVLCSHVLEHVADDRAAMRELARVLRPGGWAIVMIPYRFSSWTDEDPSVTDPAQREHRFGQAEHVRFYGLDVATRLGTAGFDVQLVTGTTFVRSNDLERFRIDGKETVFACRTW